MWRGILMIIASFQTGKTIGNDPLIRSTIRRLAQMFDLGT